MQYEAIKAFTKCFQNIYFAENLMMGSSEPPMILILFLKIWQPCDFYKLYSYKKLCKMTTYNHIAFNYKTGTRLNVDFSFNIALICHRQTTNLNTKSSAKITP